MQKALTYLLVRLGDPSELQTPIAQCDINSTTPLSYRLRLFVQNYSVERKESIIKKMLPPLSMSVSR